MGDFRPRILLKLEAKSTGHEINLLNTFYPMTFLSPLLLLLIPPQLSPLFTFMPVSHPSTPQLLVTLVLSGLLTGAYTVNSLGAIYSQ